MNLVKSFWNIEARGNSNVYSDGARLGRPKFSERAPEEKGIYPVIRCSRKGAAIRSFSEVECVWASVTGHPSSQGVAATLGHSSKLSGQFRSSESFDILDTGSLESFRLLPSFKQLLTQRHTCRIHS